jgi:two-component system OmpR family sensor kinase
VIAAPLRSLRARLIGAAAIAIFASVAVLGGASILFVAHQLRSSLDRSLRQRAIEVARLSASAPALLTAPGVLDAPSGGRLITVEVVDSRARILARSAALGGKLLPGGVLLTQALAQGRSGYETAPFSGQETRVYVAPLASVSGAASGGAVLVAASLTDIDDPIRRLRRLIGFSALGAAVLGAIAAAVLTGRGLRPLRRLSAAAGQIEQTGDASARLPEPSSADEVHELAVTLNHMLATLERARQTERRFLADASHELRTPLTSLRGNAAYVARHGADPDVIADIEADAARLGRLLDDLLALEREQAANPPLEPVSLDELVIAAAAREPRVKVERSEPVRVAGERGALERALENLIANALVHGPQDGRVSVGVDRVDGRARMWVSDEGEGLAPADVEAAFGRFWRGRSTARRPGSGLGLAIVRATAQRHHGTVRVRGSRFEIDLPAL